MSRKTIFEERIEIVEYVAVSEHSYSQAAEHFNVSYQQARSWVLKAKASGYTALKDHHVKTQIKEQEVYDLFLKKVREIQNKE